MGKFKRTWLYQIEDYFSESMLEQMDKQLFDKFIELTGIQLNRKIAYLIGVLGIPSEEQIYYNTIDGINYGNMYCWMCMDRRSVYANEVTTTIRWHDPVSNKHLLCTEEVPDSIVLEWMGDFDYTNYREVDISEDVKDIRQDLQLEEFPTFNVLSHTLNFGIEVEMKVKGISHQQAIRIEEWVGEFIGKYNKMTEEERETGNSSMGLVHSFYMDEYENGIGYFNFDMGSSYAFHIVKAVVILLQRLEFSIASVEFIG